MLRQREWRVEQRELSDMLPAEFGRHQLPNGRAMLPVRQPSAPRAPGGTDLLPGGNGLLPWRLLFSGEPLLPGDLLSRLGVLR
jgi:hypothetical protein